MLKKAWEIVYIKNVVHFTKKTFLRKAALFIILARAIYIYMYYIYIYGAET